MKRVLFLLLFIDCALMSFSKNYNTDNKVSILIASKLKEMSNSWYEYNIIKMDKIDTLYSLPTECNEYIEAVSKLENIKNDGDSLSYYISISKGVSKDKNEKLFKYYQDKIDFFQNYKNININKLFDDIQKTISQYKKTQKGWKVRCRVKSNSDEVNMEFHFNKSMDKITEVLNQKFALLYDDMVNEKNSITYFKIKNIYDKRNSNLDNLK